MYSPFRRFDHKFGWTTLPTAAKKVRNFAAITSHFRVFFSNWIFIFEVGSSLPDSSFMNL
jgi:hypothetical protein